MRIAIDARFIGSSTGRYVERLLHHLQSLDADNEYVVLVLPADVGVWVPQHPNFSVLVADYPYYSLREQIGFLRFLNGLQADVVHFALPQQPVFYRGRRVTTFHDLTLLKAVDPSKRGLRAVLKHVVGTAAFRRAARTSDVVLTPSRYTRDDVVRFAGVDPGRVRVTYEAAEQSAALPERFAGPRDRVPYLLYVGQQSPYKNVRRLIEAHQSLLVRHPDLRLALIGRPSDQVRANEEWVRRSGFRNVDFVGFVDDAELRGWYQGAACYVFPSLMEGFGLPGLEAMSAGVPVVSSSATCLPEIYGAAAIYFDPTDSSDMASAIEVLLTDPARVDLLVRSGYDRAAAFSWRRMAAETLEAYRLASEEA